MAKFRQAVKEAVAGAFGNSEALASQSWAETLNQIQEQDKSKVGEAIRNGINNLLDGGGKPRPPSPIEIPGGQCPIFYDVLVETTRFNGVVSTSSFSRLKGPIGGAKVYDLDDNNGYYKKYGFTVDGGTLFQAGADVAGFWKYARLVSVTPSDGLPDTCGNTPNTDPVPFPSGGYPVPISPFSYEGAGGVSLTASPSMRVLPPLIVPPGDIVVPIILQDPQFNLNLTLNVNTGDINFNFGGTPGNRNPNNRGEDGSRNEPGCNPPPPPSDANTGDTDYPEDGDGVIVAVLVTVTNVATTQRATKIFQDENPVIYAPTLGYINFLCRVGTTNVAGWTSDQPVKNRRNLIPCPYSEGAIAVRGTPDAGVSWVITPIYDNNKSPQRKAPAGEC